MWLALLCKLVKSVKAAISSSKIDTSAVSGEIFLDNFYPYLDPPLPIDCLLPTAAPLWSAFLVIKACTPTIQRVAVCATQVALTT